jgi:hypothetical protein
MPTPKKTGKVMDTVHPGDTPPSTSSRPVIITNRPYMTADPMLSTSDATGVNDEEKLSGEPSGTAKDTPHITREAKDIAPVATDSKAAATTETKEVADNAEKPSTADTTAPKPEPAPAEPPQPATEGPVTEDTASQQTPDEVAKPEDTDEPESDDEKKKQFEIEHHIAAGTYFVPIGRVKHRRRVVLALIVFGALFAVIMLDLLLDMDILHISGIPHTTFFK